MKRIGKILIGCFVILIVIAILGAIFGGIIIKKLISGVVQQKTGVQVNIDDINKGKLTYTDPKTGQTLNIGSNKIPDNFPKDFPIYPESTITSSLSGNAAEKNSGFWLTLTTNDNTNKVTSFYKENLETNGWQTQTTAGSQNGTNWAVTKKNLSGYITITTADNQTSILIVLGEQN